VHCRLFVEAPSSDEAIERVSAVVRAALDRGDVVAVSVGEAFDADPDELATD